MLWLQRGLSFREIRLLDKLYYTLFDTPFHKKVNQKVILSQKVHVKKVYIKAPCISVDFFSCLDFIRTQK